MYACVYRYVSLTLCNVGNNETSLVTEHGNTVFPL